MALRTLAAFSCAAAAACGIAVYIGEGTLSALELATREQCRTRAWPAHQAEAHEAFCRAYLSEKR